MADNDKLLNIVNASDLTDWFKTFTWGDTAAAIRFADIKQREFVAANADAVAKMMRHAYIKKFIPFYMNELIGTAALTVPGVGVELPDCVRAAANDGFSPYIFNAAAVPPEFTAKIKKLNEFLFDAARQYIARQTTETGSEFTFDIQYLTREFADYRTTMNRARWNAKLPPRQHVPGGNILQQIKDMDNSK